MRNVMILILGLAFIACTGDPTAKPTSRTMPLSSPVATGGRFGCECSPEVLDPEIGGCSDSDGDGDCICLYDDKCPGEPGCGDRVDTDGDGKGDACDELPNTADPEATLADLDARLDAIEAALLMAGE